MKICSVCKISKDESEFWKSRNSRSSDGLKYDCKDCSKTRRKKWNQKRSNEMQ